MLVFHRYGTKYFLSEIWDGRSNTGIRLQESNSEKEIRMASNVSHDGAELVIVAMNHQ